jgi:Putative glutamine amidotransferase/Exo-beta-D-glucosaminidase Ig-fold domain
VTVELYDTSGRRFAEQSLAASVQADSAEIRPLEIALPQEAGAYLLRMNAYEGDECRSRAERWLQVQAPVGDREIRVVLLGQDRYTAPIREALEDVAGISLTCVDETSRDPQDSSWSEGLAGRIDVLWYTGWDYGAHLFRDTEWTNIADAVAAGVGFIHTGGQASFHGGDGRGALIDSTPLDPVLPVALRPHDGIWDRVPAIDPGAAEELGVTLDGFPFRGFSRTEARPGGTVHATIGGYPLLVTGDHGEGKTVVFTASLTKPLRMFRIGEGLDWEDPLDVEPHWARDDIKAYGPYWRGTQQLALALLQSVAGMSFRSDPARLADDLQRPLFEQLAELDETTLEVTVEQLDWDERAGQTTGRVKVRNRGAVVARLVRGSVVAATADSRFRDGFVDLLPGEDVELRFECAGRGDAIEAVELRAQNASPVRAAAQPA